MKLKEVKKLLLAACFILAGQAAAAQVQVAPLKNDPARAKYNLPKSKTRAAKVNAVSLPFFDDFAKNVGSPDSSLWVPTGGVYINNRFADEPPTKNVATFDGLQANGTPYPIFSSPDITDSLVSQPINLGSLQPADSVYLSFYWQAGGLNITPPSNNQNYFLKLEFREQGGTWTEVWRQSGTGRNTPFELAFVPVNASQYFYNGFQFRFMTSGSIYGLEGLWNVDYVLLDRNRTVATPFEREDVAVSMPLNTLLNGYSSMPLFEFYSNVSAAFNDSVTTTVNNLNQVNPQAIVWRGYSKAIKPVAPADSFLFTNQVGLIQNNQKQFLIHGAPAPSNIPQASDTLKLYYTLFIDAEETNPAIRYNDTISRTVTLSNYFAYDDGTAEMLINTPIRASLATRYQISQQAYVTALKIYFTGSTSGSPILNFKIWGDNNGVPNNSALHQQGIPVPLSQQDQYVEVPLMSPVPVNGVFYVGWTQTSTTSSVFTSIGVDLNNHVPGAMLVTQPASTTTWDPVTFFEGSVMIRPVIALTVNVSDNLKVPLHKVYPNPTNGTVNIDGEFNKVTVYNITGSRLLESTSAQLDLSQQPAGMYLLHVQSKSGTRIHKIVLTK